MPGRIRWTRTATAPRGRGVRLLLAQARVQLCPAATCAVTKTKAKELFDALELEALCGETFDATTPRPHSSTPLAHATADATIYVSNEGSDGNEGTSIKATGRDSPRGALQVAQAVLLGGEEALRRVAPPASRHLTCTQAIPPAPLFARVPVRSLSAAASLCHSL